MTTNTFSAAPTNAADADFRLWGKGISDGLAAIGLVKTADTGQINWATVLKPASTSTQQGYEVWRFADTLQSTAPLYLRIGYGSGSSNAAHPSVWVTVGKGSDGAGNITGSIFAQQQLQSGSANTPAVASYLSSGDGSLLVFSLFPAFYATQSMSAPLLALERSRAADGTATGTGVFGFFYSGTVNLARGSNYASVTNTAALTGFPVAIPCDSGTDRSLAAGSKAPVFPGAFHDWMGTFWQPRCMVGGMRSDLGFLSPITVPGFNTYMPLGAAAQTFGFNGGTFASAAMAWW